MKLKIRNGSTRLAIRWRAPESFAAEELRRYLKLATGAVLPMTGPESGAAGGVAATQPWIWLGRARAGAGPDGDRAARTWLRRVAGLPAGGYGLRTFPAGLLIAGRDYAGLVSGVYDFLETAAGIRFLEPDPGGEQVPRRAALEIPPLDRLEAPAFEFRCLPGRLDMLDWMAKNRLNVCNVSPRTWDTRRAELWPEIKKRGLRVAVMEHCTDYFFPLHTPEAEAECRAHPAYYALVKGRRTFHQVCYSNPDVVRILSDAASRWIERCPEVEVLDVEANDGNAFCECPRCRAAGPGRLLYEVNRAIAVKVRRVRPEVRVAHCNYWPGTLAPEPDLVPEPGLMCLYCPYQDEAKFHAIYDYRQGVRLKLNEPQGNHRAICRNIRAWRQAHDVLVASYFSDQIMRGQTYMPYPDVIRNDLRYYRAIGVKGFYDVFCIRALWWMDTLNLRAFARLMWNPDEDLAAMLADFYAAYFGRAGGAAAALDQSIGELMRRPLVHGFLMGDVLGIQTFGDHVKGLAADYQPDLDPAARRQMAEWKARARACVGEARRLARAERPLIRRRVARLALCLDNLEARLDVAYQNVIVAWHASRVAEARDPAARRACLRSLRAAIREAGVLHRAFDRSRARWRALRPPAPGADRLAEPARWSRRLMERYRQVLKELHEQRQLPSAGSEKAGQPCGKT